MKAFIFQGKYDTAVIIATTSFIASSILLEKFGNDDDSYYLAGSVMCYEGAHITVGPFIDVTKTKTKP